MATVRFWVLIVAVLATTVILIGVPAASRRAPGPTVAAAAVPAGETITCAGSHDAGVYTWDPCDSVSQYMVAELQVLQAATVYKNWAKANPGELATMKAYLADTAVYTSGLPARFPAKTAYGESIQTLITMCKAVGCSMAWPSATTAHLPDIQPPSAPTNLQVTG